jgi:hypothetical protein
MLLLIAAKAIDDRVVADKERAQAWSWILDDIEPEDAKTALRQHYRQSTKTVMPNDILQLARIAKRDRQPQNQIQPVVNAVPPPEEVKRQIASFRLRTPWD